MTPAADADYQSLQRTIAELTVENERLVKALRFYADGHHFEHRSDWNSFKMGEPPPPPELLDSGEIARDALNTQPA